MKLRRIEVLEGGRWVGGGLYLEAWEAWARASRETGHRLRDPYRRYKGRPPQGVEYWFTPEGWRLFGAPAMQELARSYRVRVRTVEYRRLAVVYRDRFQVAAKARGTRRKGEQRWSS